MFSKKQKYEPYNTKNSNRITLPKINNYRHPDRINNELSKSFHKTQSLKSPSMEIDSNDLNFNYPYYESFSQGFIKQKIPTSTKSTKQIFEVSSVAKNKQKKLKEIKDDIENKNKKNNSIIINENKFKKILFSNKLSNLEYKSEINILESDYLKKKEYKSKKSNLSDYKIIFENSERIYHSLANASQSLNSNQHKNLISSHQNSSLLKNFMYKKNSFNCQMNLETSCNDQIDPLYRNAFHVIKKKIKTKIPHNFLLYEFKSHRKNKKFKIYEKENDIIKFPKHVKNKLVNNLGADDDYQTDDDQLNCALQKSFLDLKIGIKINNDYIYKKKRYASLMSNQQKSMRTSNVYKNKKIFPYPESKMQRRDKNPHYHPSKNNKHKENRGRRAISIIPHQRQIFKSDIYANFKNNYRKRNKLGF